MGRLIVPGNTPEYPLYQPISGGMMCPDNQTNWISYQNRPGHTLGQKNISDCTLCTKYSDKLKTIHGSAYVGTRSNTHFAEIKALWEADQPVITV